MLYPEWDKKAISNWKDKSQVPEKPCSSYFQAFKDNTTQTTHSLNPPRSGLVPIPAPPVLTNHICKTQKPQIRPGQATNAIDSKILIEFHEFHVCTQKAKLKHISVGLKSSRLMADCVAVSIFFRTSATGMQCTPRG